MTRISILLMFAAFSGGPASALDGPAVDFTVRRTFSDGYNATGPNTDLTIRRKNWGPSLTEYEGTGRLLGREFFTPPLLLRRDTFGSRREWSVEAGEISMSLELFPDWQEMSVKIRRNPSLSEGLASALIALLGAFPTGRPLAAETAVAEPDPGEILSYRFLRGGPDLFYVEGPGIRLHVYRHPWGTGFRYRVRGKGFGVDFDREEELYVETDPTFLGPRGYRIQGSGIALEARHQEFGETSLLQLSGKTTPSGDLSLFAFSLAHYIVSR